jgi:hypothetical protein
MLGEDFDQVSVVNEARYYVGIMWGEDFDHVPVVNEAG